MRIGTFDTNQRVLVIAEIGNNHEGSAERALALVRAAAAAGADAVKVQTFRTEHFVNRRQADRFARLKSFELPIDAFAAVSTEARALGLLFIATPLDLHSAAALEPIVDAYKIASGDITFEPLLGTVAATGKPVILSTGASTLDEVDLAAARLRAAWPADAAADRLGILHCVSSYPAPIEEVNLRAIRTLADRCGATAGYSDHTLGIDAAVTAVAAGAAIVEKHLTLDKQFSDFRDHQLSADPQDLRDLVARIRQTERMLGTADKRVQPSEAEMRDAIRRSAVMARDGRAGEPLMADDVTWLRPAGGLTPGAERALIGRRLRRDVSAGETLGVADVE